MSDQYAPKPVTEEDVLRALINLHKRVDRCMFHDREPCGQDLELIGKTLTEQLELLRVECVISAECDAHGDWMSDGCDLNAERDAFLYEGGAEDHAQLMAEHMAKQPKEVVCKDFF